MDQVLVVAHRTAGTPALLEALRERAERGSAEFHLLVPSDIHATWPRRREKVTDAELVLALALPLIEEATGCEVRGSLSIRHDPMDAIEDALRSAHFDEIIISTLPRNVSRWLHVDLPRRVAHFGLPVSTVIARQRAAQGTAGASRV